MKTAELILDNLENFIGHASLYKLSESIEEYGYCDDDAIQLHDYVICSTTHLSVATETYIFPADEQGNITSWHELEGSKKDCDSHDEVLGDIGYVIDYKIKIDK